MISSASRSPSSETADSLLGELAEELAGRLRAGGAVDLDAFLADHPEHAEALRRLLPAIRVMADLGRSAAPRPPARPGPTRSLSLACWATTGSSARWAGAGWASSMRRCSSR